MPVVNIHRKLIIDFGIYKGATVCEDSCFVCLNIYLIIISLFLHKYVVRRMRNLC